MKIDTSGHINASQRNTNDGRESGNPNDTEAIDVSNEAMYQTGNKASWQECVGG